MILTTTAHAPGTDPALTVEHTACVWRTFEPIVRRLVIGALLRLPLRKLCVVLEKSGISHRCPDLVRVDLANGHDVDELVQDVACVFVRAVQRGCLVAARPVLYRWFEKTIYYLVPERAKHTAIAALTGAALCVRPGNDNDDETGTSNDPIVFGSWPTPEEAVEQVQGARVRSARLTEAQREAVVLASRGLDTAETARALGVSEGAVRLRLMQARRRLRKI